MQERLSCTKTEFPAGHMRRMPFRKDVLPFFGTRSSVRQRPSSFLGYPLHLSLKGFPCAEQAGTTSREPLPLPGTGPVRRPGDEKSPPWGGSRLPCLNDRGELRAAGKLFTEAFSSQEDDG